MGHIVGNLGYGVEMFGSTHWLSMSLSTGSPASHTGIGVGPLATTADKIATLPTVGKLLIAALQGQSVFEAEISGLPTQAAGPFPGVAPAAWLGTLTATQKADLRQLAISLPIGA